MPVHATYPLDWQSASFPHVQQSRKECHGIRTDISDCKRQGNWREKAVEWDLLGFPATEPMYVLLRVMDSWTWIHQAFFVK